MTVDEMIDKLINLRDHCHVPGDARVFYATRVMDRGRPSITRQEVVVGIADFGREVMIGNAWDEWVMAEGSKLAKRLRENGLDDG